jgi:serine/threonine protein kinase
MGNWNECTETRSLEYELDEPVDVFQADRLELLGVGSFARVFKLKLKNYENEQDEPIDQVHYSRPLALKEFVKAYIINHDDSELANCEVRLLKAVSPHPFISEYITSFQDKDKAYILMEYVPWGDLLYHMKIEKKSTTNGKLTEEQAKFMCACLVLAISHVHDKGVIHRDIKPDNVMIDDLGYPKIVDFGVADFVKDIVNGSHFGTLSYMAPEMVLKEEYSYSADYYSLGVLLLLILTGDMFAVGKTVEEAQKHVLKRRRTLTMKKLKKRYSFLSNECVDFLFKLLQGYPNERLGNKNGINDIKAHHWLMNIPWKQIEKKNFNSPLSKFVDNYKNHKSLGEQHYIGLNKRDVGLKEKEDKAKEILKISISETDPDKELWDKFGEFTRINVEIIEEEITYEQINSYQGSTYPEPNYFNKKQTTPSIGNPTGSVTSNYQDEKLEGEYKTQKEFEKTNKNMRFKESKHSRKTGINDSVAIIEEIIKDEVVSIDDINNGRKTTSKPKVTINGYRPSRTSKPTNYKENEVPLFTKQEREKYDSIYIPSDLESEQSVFVLTPSKSKKVRENAIFIPATRKIKPKHKT